MLGTVKQCSNHNRNLLNSFVVSSVATRGQSGFKSQPDCIMVYRPNAWTVCKESEVFVWKCVSLFLFHKSNQLYFLNIFLMNISQNMYSAALWWFFVFLVCAYLSFVRMILSTRCDYDMLGMAIIIIVYLWCTHCEFSKEQLSVCIFSLCHPAENMWLCG